jgi:hypothetical protein
MSRRPSIAQTVPSCDARAVPPIVPSCVARAEARTLIAAHQRRDWRLSPTHLRLAPPTCRQRRGNIFSISTPHSASTSQAPDAPASHCHLQPPKWPKDLLPRAKPESTNPSTAVSCYSSSSAAERPTMDRPLRPTSVPTDAPRAPSLPLAPRWPHQPRGQAPSQPLTSAPLRPPPATVEHRQW